MWHDLQHNRHNINNINFFMEFLNQKEHLTCFLYNKESPRILYINELKDKTFELNSSCNQILFLLKGKIMISDEESFYKILNEKFFLLLPNRHKYIIKVQEDSCVFIVDMNNRLSFCNHFSFELLYKLNEKRKPEISKPLEINEIIFDYLNLFIKTFNDGLKCAYFFELKQRELLYYLRAYYSKEDLFAFFTLILNNDITFSELVFQNYKSIKNMNELAPIANYSVSGFRKRFMKVFGMPPQQWLNEIRGKEIYYQINSTQKSFKEIAIEYNFSSSKHFNVFCKKIFGLSPGTLRKNVKNNVEILGSY